MLSARAAADRMERVKGTSNRSQSEKRRTCIMHLLRLCIPHLTGNTAQAYATIDI